jgi:uncharacterized protein YkwD
VLRQTRLVVVLVALLICAATASAASARPTSSQRARAAHARSAHAKRTHKKQPVHKARRRVPPPRAPATPTAPAVPPPPAVPAVCPNTNVLPTPANLAVIQDATLCLINQQRVAAGLVAMSINPLLEAAAGQHTSDMIANDYFAHNSPNGSTPLSRLLGIGYILPNFGYAVGENIAWGTLNLATPAAIVIAWMNSPEHRANILDKAYVQTGFGIAPSAPAAVSNGNAGALYDEEFGMLIAPTSGD